MRLDVQWHAPPTTSRLHGSLQMGPGFGFGDWKLAQEKPRYAEGLAALRDLGADLVRYQGWKNRPDLVVAEPQPPSDGKTSWDFSRIDPPFFEFLDANGGRPFIMNFSTPPAWIAADDAGAIAEYFARFVSWYVEAGFTDEAGARHPSGHCVAFPYWEVLNEPDLEGEGDPARYAALYDMIVARLHRICPDTRFVGLALASTLSNPAFTAHFHNPRNHRPGVPLDYVSYHFYAQYGPEQSAGEQAATVFDQADRFLDTVGYIAALRDELSPSTGILITEIGAMKQGARNARPKALILEAQLSSALYAYLYARLAVLGVESAHVSGLVAVQPDEVWQELAMIEWASGRPNARYWVLKLLIEHMGPGSQLAPTRNVTPPPYPLPSSVLEAMARRQPVFGQGFVGPTGLHEVLLVNRGTDAAEAVVPGLAGGRLYMLEAARPTEPARASSAATDAVTLSPLAVAIATLPG
jgi:hypothetical protein